MAKYLVPEPQKIRWLDGNAKLSGFSLAPGSCPPAMASPLAAFFPNTAAGNPVGFEPDPAMDAEEYAIEIQPDRIAIRFGSERGLFYAFQTIRQLRDGDFLQCVLIEDKPALAVRGFQIPFRSMRQMSAEDGFRIVEMAAKFKLNTLLVMYDDRFPFQSHPDITSGNSFSIDQIRRLVAMAENWHIDVIPCLQCFAHLDFVLKHPSYAHLKEGGVPFSPRCVQICPNNPGGFELFKELAGEIIKVHPGKYFHIGAVSYTHLRRRRCPV